MIQEALKGVLRESDKEYDEFMQKAYTMDDLEKLEFIENEYGKENVYHDLVMWCLDSNWWPDFLKYELEKCAPKKDYWTQVRNLYDTWGTPD